MSNLWTIDENSFNVDQYPYCCGLDVACGFTIRAYDEEKEKENERRRKDPKRTYWDWIPEPAKPQTLEQIYKWYEKRISTKRAAQLVQMALISKYKTPLNEDGRTEQIPGFIDYLKSKKWEVNQTFINPAHGNEITILQKKFRGRNMNNW